MTTELGRDTSGLKPGSNQKSSFSHTSYSQLYHRQLYHRQLLNYSSGPVGPRSQRRAVCFAVTCRKCERNSLVKPKSPGYSADFFLALKTYTDFGDATWCQEVFKLWGNRLRPEPSCYFSEGSSFYQISGQISFLISAHREVITKGQCWLTGVVLIIVVRACGCVGMFKVLIFWCKKDLLCWAPS